MSIISSFVFVLFCSLSIWFGNAKQIKLKNIFSSSWVVVAIANTLSLARIIVHSRLKLFSLSECIDHPIYFLDVFTVFVCLCGWLCLNHLFKVNLKKLKIQMIHFLFSNFLRHFISLLFYIIYSSKRSRNNNRLWLFN